MIQRPGEIPLTQVGDSWPGLQKEARVLEHLDSSFYLCFKLFTRNVQDLWRFVWGHALHIWSEWKDKSRHKQSVWPQRLVDVRNDVERLVTSVKQVEGTYQVVTRGLKWIYEDVATSWQLLPCSTCRYLKLESLSKPDVFSWDSTLP